MELNPLQQYFHRYPQLSDNHRLLSIGPLGILIHIIIMLTGVTIRTFESEPQKVKYVTSESYYYCNKRWTFWIVTLGSTLCCAQVSILSHAL